MAKTTLGQIDSSALASFGLESSASESSHQKRRMSIDVLRGMVMFLMLAEVLHWEQLASASDRFSEPVQRVLQWIVFHTTHVQWRGCSLHDMIQPVFSFLVGTSLAFSYTKRIEQGQSWTRMLMHAIVRSVILITLGIFLRSLGKPQTNFTFDDTLTQIGLGYGFLFLFGGCKQLSIGLGVLGILSTYWLLFALYPLPPASFDYPAVGVPDTWQHHASGFAAHWNKNSNAAWAFDVEWMNLFPREKVYQYSGGGYCTLSFLPTLGTMLLGLLAGNWLREESQARRRSLFFLLTAGVCLLGAWALDALGVCPLVKRIWTPSWTLWSGGICFLWLLVLSWICDDAGYIRWSYFFRVIGANSIIAYVMSWTMESWVGQAIERHFGFAIRALVPEVYRTFVLGWLILLVFWLILDWLARRKIFVRI